VERRIAEHGAANHFRRFARFRSDSSARNRFRKGQSKKIFHMVNRRSKPVSSSLPDADMRDSRNVRTVNVSQGAIAKTLVPSAFVKSSDEEPRRDATIRGDA